MAFNQKGVVSYYCVSDGSLFGSTILEPQFSRGPGVLYEYPIISSMGIGDSYRPLKDIVDGDYYLLATRSTEVQSVYVHNQNLFVDSISFSFECVGISIDLKQYQAVAYYATPLTLPGYHDAITRQTYLVTPVDYGFEERYYFEEHSASHSISGLNFQTKRLRAGYIKEEYINLSPRRDGAGTAYLEYYFEKPVYQLNVQLSLWSAKERIQSGDVAVIQYLSDTNEWVDFYNMFSQETPLPADRSKPRDYEFYFIEGTKGLRYYTHTDYPASDRNKGRICIGKSVFTCYDFPYNL